MEVLKEQRTLDGRFGAHCGLCWEPAFRLWASAETPDYARCPLGDYTAQTCPNAVGAARSAAFFAELRGRGLTLAEHAANKTFLGGEHD